MFLSDARDYQILILSLFLFLGILTRDWTLQPQAIFSAIAACVLTQLLLTFFVDFVKSKKESKDSLNQSQGKSYQKISNLAISGLRSAAITGLGLSLLLRANDYNTMALAGCLAIASKFFFRVENKHFFNPANFGIIAVLILTKDAWISPGQWGTDWWYLLLFIGLGGIVLKKVGRWDTSAVFLLVYAGLEALKNLWLGWDWDIWQHQLTSGSLLLFALFMLTDPRSIPNARSTRIIWAIVIAVVTFILRDYFYISTAIFWALFFISPLTIWFDRIKKAPRFNWVQMSGIEGFQFRESFKKIET
ncbi:MAG: RnfABCDGE type electron transport complex subunit D [Prochloraceae cyanobacterium]